MVHTIPKEKDQLRKIMLQNHKVDNINKYTNARKLARKTVRKTKQKYHEQLQKDMEEKRINYSPRALYRTITIEKKGLQPRSETFLKKAIGDLFKGKAEIITRWKKYFADLLSVKAAEQNTPNVRHKANFLMDKPTYRAIKTLKKAMLLTQRTISRNS